MKTIISVVILAAGKGKRMNNPNQAKVMSLIDNKPLLGHVLYKISDFDVNKKVIIVGYKKESVIEYLNNEHNDCNWVEQKEQLGTGHAVNQARDNFQESKDDILILCGDVPNLSKSTIKSFIDNHNNSKADISVLSTDTPNPFGYGRIIRDDSGGFTGIVEEKDANEEQKKITEINSGVFLVNSDILFSSLSKVSNFNAQGEYYLTDIISISKDHNAIVKAFNIADFDELLGVNTPEDLKRAESFYFNSK